MNTLSYKTLSANKENAKNKLFIIKQRIIGKTKAILKRDIKLGIMKILYQ